MCPSFRFVVHCVTSHLRRRQGRVLARDVWPDQQTTRDTCERNVSAGDHHYPLYRHRWRVPLAHQLCRSSVVGVLLPDCTSDRIIAGGVLNGLRRSSGWSCFASRSQCWNGKHTFCVRLRARRDMITPQAIQDMDNYSSDILCRECRLLRHRDFHTQ